MGREMAAHRISVISIFARDWETYRERFIALMAERQIEKRLEPSLLDGDCLYVLKRLRIIAIDVSSASI
jgi:hypothetical protein